MAQRQDAQRPVERAEDATIYYVPLTQRLLWELRDSPLAVGVYALVARVYRATKAAVPLSAGDLRRYDPSLSQGAAGRALDRLERAGYLLRAEGRGRRNVYQPSWGLISGAPRPWALEESRLGRPPHLLFFRLPQDLLDRYMGRLEPSARGGALVSRYTTVPLLCLADVGAYGLAMASYPAASQRLEEAGLLAGGLALPLPTAQETLALASQRRLFDAGSPVALTDAGLLRLGVAPAPPPQRPADGDALLFLERDQAAPLIGQSIGDMIGSPKTAQATASASQRPRGRAVPAPRGSHGVSCKKDHESTTQRTAEKTAEGGGGDDSSQTVRPGQAPEQGRSEKTAGPGETAGQAAETPLSPAEQVLRDLGVRADVARSLAGRPIEQVRRVIAQARRRPNIECVAGWVVSVLRSLPQGAPAAAPKASDIAILSHTGLSALERSRWLKRFRKADAFERATVIAEFEAAHPPEVASGT